MGQQPEQEQQQPTENTVQGHDPNQQFEGDPSGPQQDEQSPDNDSKAQVPQSQQQNSNQNMMDSMFGDFGNEPFSNGFEDEFGDIDTAFF